MYKALAGLCFTAGRLSEAMQVIQWYAEETAERDMGMYHRLLRNLDDEQSVSEVEQVSVAAYSMWLNVLAPRGFVGDAYTYFQVIKGLAGLGAWEDVIACHKHAHEANVSLWIVTVNTVMGAYIRLNRPSEALELISPFLRRGPPDPKSASQNEILAWDSCLSRACLLLSRETATKDQARLLLQALKRQSPSASSAINPKAYLRLIQACGAAKIPEQALEVLSIANRRDKSLLAKDSESAPKLYNAVIGAFAEARQLPEALELMSAMRQKSIRPSAVTYTVLLSGCDGRGDDAKVKELMLLMEKDKVKPDTYLATTVIALTPNLRNRTWAEELHQRMVPYITQPSAVSYGAQIHAAGQTKGSASLEEVRTLLEEAKEKQLVNSEAPYVEFLRLLYKRVPKDRSSADTSLQLLDEMRSLGVTPGVQSYRWLLKSLKAAMRYNDILQLAKDIPRAWLIAFPPLATPIVVAHLKNNNQVRQCWLRNIYDMTCNG